VAENPKISALIKLLDEPDDKTYQIIREKIWSFGTEALPPLEKAWETNFNPLVQERIVEIRRNLQRTALAAELAAWVKTSSSDLLKGYLLVTKLNNPDLDEKAIVTRIEEIRMDVWLELHENLTALENVKVLNHILFGIHLFEGNKINPVLPANSWLDTFLQTHLGSPLSLGMLYIIIAEKLGLPITGVSLPQHFILAYLADSRITDPTSDQVLFYINPFNKGAVFTRREIELFIRQLKIKTDSSFFAPCTNTEVIRRLINSLIFACNKTGDTDKTEDLEYLLKSTE